MTNRSSSVSGGDNITTRSSDGNCDAGDSSRGRSDAPVEVAMIAIVKTIKDWFHKNSATTGENKIQIQFTFCRI